MKSKLNMLLVLVLAIVVCFPVSEASATEKRVKVTTKVLTYKNQQYVELSGGNKEATKKINKILKTHAVQAAIYDRENKENFGYYDTISKVKYNKNELLSVEQRDVLNIGGLSSVSAEIIYNFDLKTGKLVTLKELTPTQKQKDNLKKALSSSLAAKLRKGVEIEKESVENPPIDGAGFYFYDNGIVIHFNRYHVLMTDSVDVKVPYTTINKK